MNIIFDIVHPSYVHVFNGLVKQLGVDGHKVLITARTDELTEHLLKYYNLPYISLGKKGGKGLSKMVKMIFFDMKLIYLVLRYNIKLGIGCSAYLVHVSLVTNMISVFVNDDDADVIKTAATTTYPYANYIFTPTSLVKENYGANHFKFPSFKELGYLHKDQFVPDEKILKMLGVKKSDIFFIVRFVGLEAYHDKGAYGIKDKYELIELLEGYGKVFITSEKDLPAPIKKYKANIKPELMHSAMYYASMYIGDSQTMAAEAAILGTPSFRCNSFYRKLSYLNELEDIYRLAVSFKNDNDLVKRITVDIPNINQIKQDHKNRLKDLYNDKANLTEWLHEKVSVIISSMN